MLWQPSLPDAYTKMAPADLAAAISRRRAGLGKDLVILGHHYQTDEIIQHRTTPAIRSKLSQTAAKLARGGRAQVRHLLRRALMAETADMLTPGASR